LRDNLNCKKMILWYVLMKKHLIFISEDSDEVLKENLKSYGDIFEISHSKYLDKREGSHPDMRISKISESLCVISPDISGEIGPLLKSYGVEFYVGVTYLSEEYPKNIAYNVLIGDKIFFHNIKYTDSVVLEKIQGTVKKVIDVKQGYAGCSSIFAGDVLITSDNGIYKNAENINRLLFKYPETILLNGFEHGFIGGCMGFSKDTGLLINCSDAFLPEDFRRNLIAQNIKFQCVGAGRLTDIGGILIFTGHR